MAKVFDSPAMRETLRRVIRAQMAYKGMEYRDLSQALAAMGVQQNESNLRSKVNNGSLGAQLFAYLLLAMGVKELDLNHVQEILSEVRVNLETD
jgi:predicted NAD/FAD-binding protein